MKVNERPGQEKKTVSQEAPDFSLLSPKGEARLQRFDLNF